MTKTWEPSGAVAGTLLPPTRVRVPSRPRAESPGATRLEQIRSVGCRLLLEYGYAGMTMRQIAARLRIKAASLYYHFPSKQDILFDLMRATASELLEGLRSLEPENLKAILKLRHEYDRLFDTILKRGQRQGVFEIEDVSVVRNCILTMCTATAGWFSPQGRLSAEQVADQIGNFVRAAVVKRNGARTPKA